ncbi:ribosome biogenesis GTP-binding protein YihA/YsxC [Candidatus Hepatobacter penaei]|uniref:ribosome biogenesis GTP-binding protein YihA/YsxC n=1 Tax=Candidatus Hepatobacter penaei TaxID=1274402 RepID=UPI000695DA03|nr:ribosome biogenesis GTP-binding protein YihA/YsxC [Candidatus Hepatobacter penaei]TGW15589.1 YihA family ribosome biogenesis GTP-binding protein [bacterium NHP-B]
MDFSQVTFLTGARALAQCPPPGLPEVAFVGRSNVGKSSLLNALWKRRAMAYVSKTPGKTAEANFFCVDDVFMCVDLPGYGYARVDKSVKRAWEKFLPAYLQTRESLVHIFVLIDARHPPQKADVKTVVWLVHGKRPFTLVMTKKDKISSQRLEEHQALWTALLREYHHHADLLAVSIKEPQAVEVLRQQVAAVISVPEATRR